MKNQNPTSIEANINTTFEQAIKTLTSISQQFQQGNLPLGQAVEKYKQSQDLIDFCKLQLAQLENINQEYVTQTTTHSFEDNMTQLLQMQNTLLKEDVSLLQLIDIKTKMNALIKGCEKELENFKTNIQIAKQD